MEMEDGRKRMDLGKHLPFNPIFTLSSRRAKLKGRSQAALAGGPSLPPKLQGAG